MKQEISAEQSIEIISRSLNKTKENLAQHSFGFLFWGWLVVITSLVHYGIVSLYYFDNNWLIWPVFMGAGFIFSIFYYKKINSKKSYSTYLDDHLSIIWQSIFISFVLAFFIAYKTHIPPTSIMLTLCGAGTVASGRLMKYKPLILGGISFFIFAIVSLYISGPENLLINALALFVGYLIPGHMLSKK